MDCRRCSRNGEVGRPVHPWGDLDSEVAVHGAAPGKMEVLYRLPFYKGAPGGRLVTAMLDILGVARNDCYLTNSCFCMGFKDRLPTIEESMSCMVYKHFEYSRLKNLKYVLLLGNDAVRQCFGYSHESVLHVNGRILDVDINERKVKVILLLHPGYLLRNPSKREKVVDALIKFKKVME